MHSSAVCSPHPKLSLGWRSHRILTLRPAGGDVEEEDDAGVLWEEPGLRRFENRRSERNAWRLALGQNLSGQSPLKTTVNICIPPGVMEGRAHKDNTLIYKVNPHDHTCADQLRHPASNISWQWKIGSIKWKKKYYNKVCGTKYWFLLIIIIIISISISNIVLLLLLLSLSSSHPSILY